MKLAALSILLSAAGLWAQTPSTGPTGSFSGTGTLPLGQCVVIATNPPQYEGNCAVAITAPATPPYRSISDVAAPVPAPAPTPPAEPSQIYGMGAGIQGLGPSQIQGGYFVGQHVGVGRYVIESSDVVRMPGGGVGTSAHAGIYNRLATLGPLTLGVIGDAGVAEGATGSAAGSFSGWSLAGVKLWKWPLSLTGAARIMTIAGSGNVAQVRLYLTLQIP